MRKGKKSLWQPKGCVHKDSLTSKLAKQANKLIAHLLRTCPTLNKRKLHAHTHKHNTHLARISRGRQRSRHVRLLGPKGIVTVSIAAIRVAAIAAVAASVAVIAVIAIAHCLHSLAPRLDGAEAPGHAFPLSLWGIGRS
eukprot:985613-Pelagomonas_calceolata.AAC.2